MPEIIIRRERLEELKKEYRAAQEKLGQTQNLSIQLQSSILRIEGAIMELSRKGEKPINDKKVEDKKERNK